MEENWVYKSHQPRLVSSPQSGADGKSGEDGVSGGALKLTYIDQSQKDHRFYFIHFESWRWGSGQRVAMVDRVVWIVMPLLSYLVKTYREGRSGKKMVPQDYLGKSGSVESINHNGSNEFSELIIDMSTKKLFKGAIYEKMIAIILLLSSVARAVVLGVHGDSLVTSVYTNIDYTISDLVTFNSNIGDVSTEIKIPFAKRT